MGDKVNIYLTQKEFDELLEYSCSVPTGVYIGKKWKRNNNAFGRGIGEEWFQGEYIQHPNKHDMASIKWSPIVVVGELEVDKDIDRFFERQ